MLRVSSSVLISFYGPKKNIRKSTIITLIAHKAVIIKTREKKTENNHEAAPRFMKDHKIKLENITSLTRKY